MGPWIGLYNPLLHRCFRRLNALSRDGVLRVTWAGRKRHAACGIVDVPRTERRIRDIGLLVMPGCGRPVEKTKIAGLIGRPTYLCPICQPLCKGKRKS